MPFEGAVKQAYSNLTDDQQMTVYQFMLFLAAMPESQKNNPPPSIRFNTLKDKISVEPNFDEPISACNKRSDDLALQ